MHGANGQLTQRDGDGHCASNGGFLNGRARRLGPFSTAGARRLRAFVHYRSSHSAIVLIITCFFSDFSYIIYEKNRWRPGLRPRTPLGELTTLPSPPSWTRRLANVVFAPYDSRLRRSSRISVPKLWSPYHKDVCCEFDVSKGQSLGYSL